MIILGLVDLMERLRAARSTRKVDELWSECQIMQGSALRKASIMVHEKRVELRARQQTKIEEWMK